MHVVREPSSPPSLWLSLGELRTPEQFPRLVASVARLRAQPRGQGEPVMVVPGFGGTDASTHLLRRYLRGLGYRVSGWGFGMNRGSVRQDVGRLRRRVVRRAERFSKPVALVGWSLGGVLSREVARDRPDVVNRVVTFGTPVYGGPKHTATARFFEKRGYDLDAIESEYKKRDAVPIQVPVTAVYTRRDGVVDWRASIDSVHSHVEHIEVTGTHIGLGVNPDVWCIVAQRLALHS